MKSTKQINKAVDSLIKTSFNSEGALDQDKITQHVKLIKTLPVTEATTALSEYLHRIRIEVTKTTLEITSSIPLSAVQIKNVTEAIRADHIVMNVVSSINPSLLGGIRVRIGDVVYDDSLIRKILQLGDEIGGRNG